LTDAVVVDASVALKWLLDEDFTEEALRLRDRWVRDETPVLGPALLPFEMANGLYKRVRKQDLDVQDAITELAEFLSWFGDVEDYPEVHSRAFEIAHELGQGAVYDSHYIALAEAWGAQLWTGDKKLWEASHGRYPFVNFVGDYGEHESGA
jgi:predicted nucleic acid-binding protein